MAEIKHNSAHTKRAQELRKNATKQENHLWYDFLRNYPARFRRQVTIDHFIVDFYCAAAKLVIELDGSQHYSEEGQAYDKRRTAVFSQYGLTVLRFSNAEIDSQFLGVCAQIHEIIQAKLGKDPSEGQLDLI